MKRKKERDAHDAHSRYHQPLIVDEGHPDIRNELLNMRAVRRMHKRLKDIVVKRNVEQCLFGRVVHAGCEDTSH